MESSSALAQDTAGSARTAPSIEQFEFTATGSEYFRIWIVNLLLTILTLGIYSAWAKVRRLRYFYGNTRLAGSSFEYHGEPLKILKGRLIAASVLIPYAILQNINPLFALPFIVLFILALPFLVVKSRQFQTRMTSWRNVRFNFTGSYGQAAWVFLGLAVLTPLTLGLIVPYMMFARHRFVIGKTAFGTAQFQFDARVGAYYLACLAAVGVVVASIVGFMVFAGGAGVVASLAGGAAGASAVMVALISGLAVFVGYLFAFALVQAMTLNAAFSGTSVDGHRLNCDLSAARLLWLYVSNALLTLITLGIYFPWATVRMTRYQLESMSLHTAGSLDEFAANEQAQISATGEEVSDLLDVDFGL